MTASSTATWATGEPEDISALTRERTTKAPNRNGSEPSCYECCLNSFSSGGKGTRTPNPLLAKQVRYQLRHTPGVQADITRSYTDCAIAGVSEGSAAHEDSKRITTRLAPPITDSVSATFVKPSFSNIERSPG